MDADISLKGRGQERAGQTTNEVNHGVRISALKEGESLAPSSAKARSGRAVGRGGVFDAFATLPATLEGEARRGKKTIGILGLGAGTCAEIMAGHHDDVDMIGWELDPAIVELARRHFAVGDLEREGRLRVVTGDAFEGCARSEIEFDGLIVDCFDENSVVVACLKDKATWEALAARLKPGGRVVANVSTGRGKGAKLDDAIACAQALADATSDEVCHLENQGQQNPCTRTPG